MSSTQQLLLAEGGGGAAPNYIEDVFSTYLATGAGTSFTINNGIDLSTKGGMAWMKRRSSSQDNYVFDTVRGAGKALVTNDTIAEYNNSQIDSFTTTGFTGSFLANASTNVFWTFRKQPKFFDVVTYTGNGSSARDIAHSLGSTPGCMMVKCTSSSGPWIVWHRSMGGNNYIQYLNNTDPRVNGGAPFWNNTAPTSTVFTVGNDSDINRSGYTYVAYLFAHDAGGFGTSGSDNVISCGSYTGNGSATGPVVNLGYEPQWVLIKNISGFGSWMMQDTMRGMSVGKGTSFMEANTSAAEYTGAGQYVKPTATGFSLLSSDSYYNTSGSTYIYIAIRRGLMKVPTDATKVFQPVAISPSGAAYNDTTTFPVDMSTIIGRIIGFPSVSYKWFTDRLRGTDLTLTSSSTAAELSISGSVPGCYIKSDTMTGLNVNDTNGSWGGGAGQSLVSHNFRRATSFFDEVCYAGTGSAQNLTHNLGAEPELIITKTRDTSVNWNVYHSAVGATKAMVLNTTATPTTATSFWNNTAPTSSVFTVGTANGTNASGSIYVAYLFATCAGVSKVGSYTGNGTTQAIACGFVGGARFVLIKRTDSTGDWYVYDTARGMSVLTDPYIQINTANAESATLGSVTTTTGGFTVDASILAAINTNAASYIFLAIA